MALTCNYFLQKIHFRVCTMTLIRVIKKSFTKTDTIKRAARKLRATFFLVENLNTMEAVYLTNCIGGFFHVLFKAFSFGQYNRITTIKGPLGAGNQFDSLSFPGD
jgi:hypothetical protein